MNPTPAAFGRDGQLARLADTLRRTGEGQSEAIALVGTAGEGKTTLLAEAMRMAANHEPPFTVLRARGVESEAEVAFAGLLELVRPIGDLIERLPEPQAQALRGALALQPGEGTDRFNVSAATLAILSLAATETPVLVVVDDLHWLDPPSAQAIVFAARRLWREGIAVVFSTRPEAHALQHLEGIPVVEVGPLAPGDAMRLARRSAGRELTDDEVEALVLGTGGNPLAIVEAARGIDVAGQAIDGVVVPLPVADRIRAGVERRLEALLPHQRRAVLVAAAAGTRSSPQVLAATLTHEAMSLDALDAAEEAGVLRVGPDAVEFDHPLTRSAVYAAALGGERRNVHRVLAMSSPAGSPERAWHLAAAAVGPDEEAARALEDAGEDAVLRGAPSSALRAFDRAAALSPDPEAAARRLLRCGMAARLDGRVDRAREVIALARDRAQDPMVRADALALLLEMDTWRAPVATARTIAVEAERVAANDPRRAALMLAEAAAAMARSGAIAEGVELADAARTLLADLGEEHVSVEFGVLFTNCMNGDGPAAAERLVRLGERLLEAPATAQNLALLQQAAWVQTWMEQYESASPLLEHAVAVGRGRAPGTLPMALATRAELAYRRGRWQTALADTTEAASLGADFQQDHPRGLALTCQARIEACMGRGDACRQTAAAAAAIGLQLGGEGSPISAWGSPALGLLALGEGRPEDAVPHLERLAVAFRRGGIREPGVVLAAGDLIEAYARSGQRDQAEEVLADFERISARTERIGARAIAARCRGLLCDDEAFEGHLERALSLHALGDNPFEAARTHLALGERLRRVRRRADARPPLREALTIFERLGAVHWAAAAAKELELTGETAAPRTGIPSDQLTPQELQVALLVAGGATNKEAGARLFLSAKTIEAHLGRIYRKLGVRSRIELASRVTVEGLQEAT